MAFQIEHLRFKDFTKCVAYTRDKIRIKFQLLQKCFVPDLHKYLWPWHDLETASSHGNLYNSFVVLRTSTIVLWVSFFTNEIRTQMEKTKTWLWNDPPNYHWDITQWISQSVDQHDWLTDRQTDGMTCVTHSGPGGGALYTYNCTVGQVTFRASLQIQFISDLYTTSQAIAHCELITVIRSRQTNGFNAHIVTSLSHNNNHW